MPRTCLGGLNHHYDPFEAHDGGIVWQRLLKYRDEIAVLGELAVEQYAYMRKFAPAFPEAFSLCTPEAGQDLQDADALME